MMDYYDSEDTGKTTEIHTGRPVGDWMKGIVLNGELYSWKIGDQGEPHHDDIDPDGQRSLQLSNIAGSISLDGSANPVESVNDILGLFSGYKNETEIGVHVFSSAGEFNFDGSVGSLKSFFKQHKPPYADDYEDGIKDVDYIRDYEAWAKEARKTHHVSEFLGRGGRGDVWQAEDEDWSKSFSVYNNPKRKKR